MNTIIPNLIGLFLLSLPATAAAQEKTGVLRQAGALHCLATLADDGPPETTDLQCQLRLTDGELTTRHYEGEIVGSGLWLVNPGPVRLVWQVLAPTDDIDPDALEGDYDIVARHDYDLAETDKNALFGGDADSIALRLLAPAVDGINPSTLLTLQTASAPHKGGEDQLDGDG